MSKKSLSTSANIAHSGYDRIEYTYEETIEQCTHIVEAVYEGSEIVDNYNDLKFSVVDKIKGDMSDSLIYVQDSYNLMAEYATGNTFVLFLDKHVSLYSTNDIYTIRKCQPSKEVDIKYIQDIINASQVEAPDKYGYVYTKSTDMKDILDVTANIFEVEVLDVELVSKYAPTTIYNCRVNKTMKNEPENSDIQIVFFNDTVEKGKDYIVLLADTKVPSKLYTLSSKNSVYTPEEANKIPELSSLTASAKEYKGGHEKNNESIYQAEQEYKNRIEN